MNRTHQPFRAKTDRENLALKVALLLLITLPPVSVNLSAYYVTKWGIEDSATARRNLGIDEIDSFKDFVGHIYSGKLGEYLAYRNYQGK